MLPRLLNSSQKTTTPLLSKQQNKLTRKNFQKRNYSHRNAQVSNLENGVFVVPTEGDNPVSTVGIFLDAGAVYEHDSVLGVSRFFEKSLPLVRGPDGVTVGEALENIGAKLQTFSTRDRIGVIGQCLNENSSAMIDILTNAIGAGAKITDEDAEKVKLHMMTEYSTLTQTYDADFLLEQLHSSAFQGTSLANSVYGSSQTIGGLSVNKLNQYKETHFTGARVAVVTSGVNPDTVAEKVSVLNQLPAGFNDAYTQPNDFVGSDVNIRDDTQPLAQVALGLNSPGRRHKDYYPYLLFQAICGSFDKRSGGFNNVISTVAEDLSSDILFVDSFQTFNFNYRDVGLFVLHASVPPHKLDDYTSILGTRLQHIAKSTSKTELQFAKNAIKTRLALQASTSAGMVEQVGENVLNRREFLSLDQIYQELDAVTVKDFKVALKGRFDDVCPAIASFGPTEEIPEYTWFKQKIGSPLW